MPATACAIAILVPTPSVLAASSGRRHRPGSNANSPANPPIPPTTSGRRVRATAERISSTARSPASMSTPAWAYEISGPVTGEPGR